MLPNFLLPEQVVRQNGSGPVIDLGEPGNSVLAVTLGVLTVTGAVRLWMVVVLALLFGLTSAADNPARQAFASEMVPPHQVRNAVTLNSILVNSARAVGPAMVARRSGAIKTGSTSVRMSSSLV